MQPEPHLEFYTTHFLEARSAQQAVAAHAGKLITQIRAQRPRVHCITNTVAANTVANALLAIGAEPSMTANPDEIEDFLDGADALSINLGTLNEEHRAAIRKAVMVARTRRMPWALDPVFVDRSATRLSFARQLVADKPTVIRGNRQEMRRLPSPESLTTRCTTGAEDEIRDANRDLVITSGHPLMARVTATGCAASALVGAFIAVEPDAWLATCCAIAVLGVSGSRAGERADAPGSFQAALLDWLFRIESDDLARHLRVRVSTTQ